MPYRFLHTCVVPLRTTRACGFNFTRINVAITIPKNAPTSAHTPGKPSCPSGISNVKIIVDEKKNLFLFYFFVRCGDRRKIRVTARIVSMDKSVGATTRQSTHLYAYILYLPR